MQKKMILHFLAYASIGVFNTGLHWGAFIIFIYGLSLPQSWSNFLAFLIAASLSFIINVKINFKSKLRLKNYIYFVVFTGALSFLMGKGAELIHLHPLVMLSFFTVVSLLSGFLFLNYLSRETAS